MAILKLKAKLTFVAVAALVVCSACSKDHGSNPTRPTAQYPISVAVQGVKGSGFTLQNNGGDTIKVTGDKDYTFNTKIPTGGVYDVTVLTQPTRPTQTCTVTNGSGVVDAKKVKVVASCTTNTYTLGGTVSGLVGQVTLQDVVNTAFTFKIQDKLIIDTPGSFTFPSALKDRTLYAISVNRQPTAQTCSVVSFAAGALDGADVSNAVVKCVDNTPTVSVANVSVVEGDAGTNYLVFAVNLSQLARYDITVDYATSDGTATLSNGDYTATSGTLTIPAGTSSGTVTVPVVGDKNPEKNETLTLTLSNATMLASTPTSLALAGTGTATGTIYNDDGGILNDTGITGCANGNTNGLSCNSIADGTNTYPGQDAEFGRDYTDNNNADGHAGFSFANIDANGASTTACVKDLTTNLTWESKTTTVGGIHYQGATYSWYDPDGTVNGGEPGTANAGNTCSLTSCDTASLVTAVNADALCGYQDWRLPTVEELSNLIDSSQSAAPTIDVSWFPNTAGDIYWTSSTYASYALYAWGVNFADGTVMGGTLRKQDPRRVRLVRGP